MRVGFSTTRQRVHTERLLHRFFTVSQHSLSLETIQGGKKKKSSESSKSYAGYSSACLFTHNCYFIMRNGRQTILHIV